jgi:cell division initiation protein
MEGTPHLLTDVKFTQLRKGGYDPEEVDNYLERINEAVAKLADNLRAATERAETAESQLSEARRAQTDAEGELERVRAGGLADTSADEEVAKVLVLAQRAADQALEEATSTASQTVADARAKAVNMLADAEQERERLLVKARKKADAVAEDRARLLHEQVDALAGARDELDADVKTLREHLEFERDRLRMLLASLGEAIEDPAGLRVADTPTLRNPEIPEVDLGLDEQAPTPFAPADDVAESVTAETPAVEAEPWSDEVVAESEADEAAASTEDDTIYLDAPAEAKTGEPGDEPAADDREGEPVAESTEGDKADQADEGEPSVDAELFSDEEGDGGSERKGTLFTPDLDDSLGPPDEEADAAMRAFFERDLDDPGIATRPRFGRRR